MEKEKHEADRLKLRSRWLELSISWPPWPRGRNNVDSEALPESGQIPLSPSVEAVFRQLRRKRQVSSWMVVHRLLRRHPEYGGGMGEVLHQSTGPASVMSRSVDAWMDEACSLVEPRTAERLHGRLLILALTRLDPSLREFLKAKGFLEAVEREMTESPAEVLVPAKPKLGESGPVDQAPVHPDHPSVDDQLGREGFARALAIRLGRIWNQYADSDGESSFILHLHGPWGSGKTSLLAMLKGALQASDNEDKESRWIVVSFNAWRHQRLEAPWWQLMDALYREAYTQLWKTYGKWWKALRLWMAGARWRFFTLRRDLVFSIGGVVLLTGLIYWVLRATGKVEQLSIVSDALAVSGDVGDFLAAIGTLISAAVVLGRSLTFRGVRSAQQFVDSSADPMAEICRHFRSLLSRIDQPIAMLIDDLDRCQEEYVIRLLEGIQTLFNDPRIVYIVAADRRWLHACYENTYAPFQESVREPGRRLGTLFLEKIFQLSVAVPRLSVEMKDAYWRYLIRGRKENVEHRLKKARDAAFREFTEAASEAEILSKLPTSAEEDPIRTQARREAAVERLATDLVEETTLYFLEQFTGLLDPNPRSMKRLLNAYAVHRDLAILSGLDVLVDTRKREQLALWTILSLRWPLLRDYVLDEIEGRSDQVDDKVHELANSSAVQDVINGKGVSASLDLATIRELLGDTQGSERPSAATVV